LRKTLDAHSFRLMMISAANNIENFKQAVNDLNVFPVPDGDTGTNMSLTMASASREMQSNTSDEVGQAAEKLASALLRGARGNSGVILSLLWRGFARSVKGKKEIDCAELAQGLSAGVEAAYKAVMKPTEGTILTVARLSARRGVEAAGEAESIEKLFAVIIEAAKETLEQTPELLPVLKQANVVDAGGMGLIKVYEGALHYLEKGEIIPPAEPQEQEGEKKEKADFAAIDTESIVYTYCTEFIVGKSGKKQDTKGLSSYLGSIGDSLVVVEDDEIIKVHVHTNNPGNAIQRGLMYGQLMTVKIENMKLQHTGLGANPKNEAAEEPAQKEPEQSLPVPPEKPFGFVAVAAGEGLSALFRELGADNIVSGGQSMNPSTDDILRAVEATPAETVFVLPNNKNIIMAAEAAVDICTDRKIVVIPTKQIPQGISAMLSFDSAMTCEENRDAMRESMDNVHTGQVTYAARDSVFDGHEITKGQFLGLCDGKVKFTDDSIDNVINDTLTELGAADCELITLYFGSEVTEDDAKSAADRVRQLAPSAEVTVVDGGQPVYYYIISVE